MVLAFRTKLGSEGLRFIRPPPTVKPIQQLLYQAMPQCSQTIEIKVQTFSPPKSADGIPRDHQSTSNANEVCSSLSLFPFKAITFPQASFKNKSLDPTGLLLIKRIFSCPGVNTFITHNSKIQRKKEGMKHLSSTLTTHRK